MGLRRRAAAAACLLPVLSGAAGATAAQSDGLAIVGDALPRPLTDAPGDPDRGRALVVDRQTGLCLLCHSGPFPEERFQGTLAPDLAGVGSRLSPGQLRLRLVDSRRLAPDTLMPPYFSTDDLRQVGDAWRGRTILSAQQIEDVVAFLATLQAARCDPPGPACTAAGGGR